MNSRGLFTCPADSRHGPLLAIAGVTGWYCPNAAHDGRPAAHPLGASPATRSRFTFAEVDPASTAAPGVGGRGSSPVAPSRLGAAAGARQAARPGVRPANVRRVAQAT